MVWESIVYHANMIEIELLIPLAYFGIVRTLSTETVKTAHFVFFLLPVYNSRTIAAIDLETAPFYFAWPWVRAFA